MKYKTGLILKDILKSSQNFFVLKWGWGIFFFRDCFIETKHIGELSKHSAKTIFICN